MKKKFRLFTTLLSFCFSMAVLCFGVYAATTVNYVVGGSVNYQVEGVYAEIETRVYRSTGELTTQANDTITTALSTLSFEDIEKRSDVALVYDTESYSSVGKDGETLTCDDLATGLALNFGESNETAKTGYVFYVVTNVKNLSPDVNLQATATTPTAFDNVWESGVLTQSTISSTDTKNIVATYGLENLYSAVTGNFTYTITVTEAPKGYQVTLNISPLKNFTLKYATNNSSVFNETAVDANNPPSIVLNNVNTILFDVSHMSDVLPPDRFYVAISNDSGEICRIDSDSGKNLTDWIEIDKDMLLYYNYGKYGNSPIVT